MQPNPSVANRSTVVRASQPKFYDPSEPYRALLAPPHPPPPVATMTSNNQNPTLSQNAPSTNIDPRTGAVKRIPQFYYPRYNEPNEPPLTKPYFSEPKRPNPNPVPPPPLMQQPAPPYFQPMPFPGDPYAQGPYYPYSTPYLIPLSAGLPVDEHIPTYPEHSKADAIAEHQKDADLSRLEVYHFTPKQDSTLSRTTAASQPIIQYHVYPYPPGGAQPPPPQSLPPQQQYPSQPYPWNAYPPNAPSYMSQPPPPNAPPYMSQPPPTNTPPYMSQPPPPLQPLAETRARGSQTEPPSTKNRGVSPIYVSPPAPVYDEDGYPYIHHQQMHADRHYVPTGRIDRRFYDSNRSTPLPDCRCLDCQQERSKVLNYYPD